MMQTARRDQRLAVRVGRLITVGEPVLPQRIVFPDQAAVLAADIGSADVEQRHVARPRKLDRASGAHDVDRAIVIVLEVEPGRRRAVDQQIVVGCIRCVEVKAGYRHIAVMDAIKRRLVSIITAHLRIAMDQRTHPVAARSKPRRDLATD